MKTAKKHNVLEGIKKEQLKRRVFTLEFKAEVVRHKKAENISTGPRPMADLSPSERAGHPYRTGVTGNPLALLSYHFRPYRSERSGFAANRAFHRRGVSSSTLAAGCGPTRCSTSTKWSYGSRSCNRQVTSKLCTMPTCLAPSSV